MRREVPMSEQRTEGGGFARTVLVFMAILAACGSYAEGPEQILFLHLKLKDGVVTSLGTVVRPGRLKTPPASQRRGEVSLELVSTNGTLLWSNLVGDPGVQRYEYEDPAHPGTLKRLEVRRTEAEFSVRTPFHPEAAELRLYRLEKTAGGAGSAVRAQGKKPLGIIHLPATEDKP